MCRDCGCSQANERAHEQGHDHRHDHHHDHHHHHHHGPGPWRAPKKALHRITLEESVLAKNDRIAAENRAWFAERGIHVMNIISSPGSGKTMLLEKTARRLSALSGVPVRMAILTGDQERDFDAERLRAAGAEVKQLNTASACHLDAEMIRKELGGFVRPDLTHLVIENVGNLVCPAAFDLGENEKIALLSTTEGEDKPSKYPLLFHEASLILITKTDLIPHLDWSLEACEGHIRSVNSRAPILRVSARTGEGMESWLDFLMSRRVERPKGRAGE